MLIIERLTGTLREQFLDVYEYREEDVEVVNSDLKKYLVWYNTKKPHEGLNYRTPFDYTSNFFNLTA
ncbi:MAG: transposase [Endomicrobium sp.]|jgi:transposase InsO family protein|nr:transposase [Endomicrobium sp.]